MSGNKRGPKPAPEGLKSEMLWWRVPRFPVDVYQHLLDEQKRIENISGLEIPLSKVLEGIVKKSMN